MQQFLPTIRRHIFLAQESRPEVAVTDPNNDIFLCETELAQDIDTKRNELSVSGQIRFPNDVAIELEMFAQPAALLFFVAEKLADGKPFERFLEFTLVRGNHAGEGGRELGTQRDFAFAFVGEIEKLIDNFCAALFFVELCRFEDGTVPFHETVAAGDFAPAREDVITHRTVIGQEIAKTG